MSGTGELSRDALAKIVSDWLMEYRTSNQRSADEQGYGIADAILANAEWEYGVLFPEIRTEPSFVGSEEGAQHFMGRPAAAVDKYATDTDKRIKVRRVKAGPWVEVS